MPLTYEIDESRRLLITRGTGDITDADLFDCRDRISRDPRFRPDLDLLADYTGATSSRRVTTPALRHLAQHTLVPPGARGAYVAGGAATYGLMRMFMAFRKTNGERVEIFESVDDALAWLGRSPIEAGNR